MCVCIYIHNYILYLAWLLAEARSPARSYNALLQPVIRPTDSNSSFMLGRPVVHTLSGLKEQQEGRPSFAGLTGEPAPELVRTQV